MAKDARAQRHRTETKKDTDSSPPPGGSEGAERREKLGEDVDTILDEIDDVLEENAEEFVRAYVQKGGE